MRERVPNYSLFDKNAKAVFSVLTKEFKYKLIEAVAKENYVKHTYRNRWRQRKIVIENQTYPVDYGFTFFVYNLWAKDHYILYNIPWEKEDSQCDFLNRVKEKIFGNQYLKNLIRGITWENKEKEFVYE